MTPQERQLVAELFDRLASLEGERRDPDAERVIAEGLSRAPNATYALVQSVLVQDEALKRADARIRELEANLGVEPPRESGGFLDNMRDAVFGRRDEGRGSVPTVRPGERPMGVPPGFRTGQDQQGGSPWGGGGPAGGPMGGGGPYGGGGPMQQPQGGGGGSFLGTAAAAAAGVIGGSLLLNSIRGMFGQQPGQAHGAFDPGLSGGGDRSPWGSGGSGDLAREAGLNDIGSSRSAGYDDGNQRTASLFGGGNDDEPDGDEFNTDGDLDIDTDTA
jgi:uncharacterized protein